MNTVYSKSINLRRYSLSHEAYKIFTKIIEYTVNIYQDLFLKITSMKISSNPKDIFRYSDLETYKIAYQIKYSELRKICSKSKGQGKK